MKDRDTANLLYFGYFSRVTLFALSFILLFLLSLFCFKKSIGYEGREQTSYQERGDITYKVNLKDNEYYEENILGENYTYIADLTESIDLNVSYSIKFNEDFSGDVDYKIIGNLIVVSEDGNKKFLDNKYVLFENDEPENINNVYYKVNKDINLNYSYYSDLASGFKNKYGINSKAYLIVYLSLSYEVDDNIIDIIDGKNGLALELTLDRNEIDIDNSHSTVNSKKILVGDGAVDISNKVLFGLGLVLICADLVLLSFIGKLLMVLTPKRSKYDVVLDSILRTYDREIVTCRTLPEFNKKHVIKVDSFKELLDAFKIIQLPIMYVNVSTHNKCHFYIIHNDEVYLYTMKAVDLENEGN